MQTPQGKAASGFRVFGLLAAITLGVVLVLALTSAGWPGSSREAASGPGGTIAAGGAAVYLISPATGASRRVPTPAPAIRADLSADGRRIAVAGLSALWVMNRDGSRPQRILRAAAADVAWSPGGSRLAIVRNEALLTISADGSDSKKVTGRAETPHWYPGGKWIVFVRNPELSSRNGAISAIRPDGGGLRRIVPEGQLVRPTHLAGRLEACLLSERVTGDLRSAAQRRRASAPRSQRIATRVVAGRPLHRFHTGRELRRSWRVSKPRLRDARLRWHRASVWAGPDRPPPLLLEPVNVAWAGRLSVDLLLTRKAAGEVEFGRSPLQSGLPSPSVSGDLGILGVMPGFGSSRRSGSSAALRLGFSRV